MSTSCHASSTYWEIRSAFDSFDDVLPAWNRLASLSPLSPFIDSSWFLSFREAFPDALASVDVHLLRHSDSLLAAIPLDRARFPLSSLCSVSNDHFPFWAVSVDLDHPTIAKQILAHSLQSSQCLCLSALHSDSSLCRNLCAAAHELNLPLRVDSDNDDCFIRLSQPWSEMQKTISHKMLKGARSKRRHLQELGHLTFESVKGGPSLDRTLTQCFILETLGWKGSGGAPILHDPQTLRFYTALAHRASKSGNLRLHCLLLDSRLIAFQFCLQSASRIDVLKISYDPEFAKFSPGDLLLLNVLELACSQGLSECHLGRSSAWKMRWATDSNPLCRISVYSNSRRASFVCSLIQTLKAYVQANPRASDALTAMLSALRSVPRL